MNYLSKRERIAVVKRHLKTPEGRHAVYVLIDGILRPQLERDQWATHKQAHIAYEQEHPLRKNLNNLEFYSPFTSSTWPYIQNREELEAIGLVFQMYKPEDFEVIPEQELWGQVSKLAKQNDPDYESKKDKKIRLAEATAFDTLMQKRISDIAYGLAIALEYDPDALCTQKCCLHPFLQRKGT